MRENAILVAYFLKIPLKFSLKIVDEVVGNSFQLTNIQIESHIDYISELGKVVRKDSTSGSRNNTVWISDGVSKRADSFVNIMINRSESNPKTILSSSIINSSALSFMKGLSKDPVFFIPLLIKESFTDKQNIKNWGSRTPWTSRIRSADSSQPLNTISPDKMCFQASKLKFYLIKYLLSPGRSSKIIINYSELEKTSLLFIFLIHLPIILTSVIILILVLSFDSGITKDLIMDEISKLPLQKYSEYLGFIDCPICLETYSAGEDIRLLSCKHCFHKNCIDSWLKTMLKCPVCRNPVTKLADSPRYEFYQSLNHFP
ncbi:hypothetical protein GINT2_002094 [Glugoides intestinalis]